MARRERTERKVGLGTDVLTAARERVSWVFETFPCVYLSGPSGKDSGAMMHLVCQEARKRGRRVGVLYLDLEAQYKVTIEQVREMFALYSDVIDPYWLAIPIHLRNAVSAIEPYWVAWDPERRPDWVRPLPSDAISDWTRFPWYRPPWTDERDRRVAMEFEEIVEHFGHWYGGQQATACFVGIRSDESLNRWRTIAGQKHAFDHERFWTTWKGRRLWNVYPIYDWHVEDVWTYFGKFGLPYNRLYDRMHQAGLTLSQMRICQPYGDDQRRGLWLYSIIEPESWARVVTRVSGANMGALYASKRGNVLGNGRVSLPPGHTWQSFVEFLLDSLPAEEADHYRDKIAVFVRWWRERGVDLPEEADPKLEAARKAPSWRRVAKVILKNDRLCKGLSFTQQMSTRTAYENYRRVMRQRRNEWQIFPTTSSTGR
jgi:predicted phosphoadenosine phosphosulfate sulfurtransferase